MVYIFLVVRRASNGQNRSTIDDRDRDEKSGRKRSAIDDSDRGAIKFGQKRYAILTAIAPRSRRDNLKFFTREERLLQLII